MDEREKTLALLPGRYRQAFMALKDGTVEEIRLRQDRPPAALIAGKERVFSPDPVRAEDLERLVEAATGASRHSAAAAFARGYLDYGGMRIGVCGTAVLREGRLCGFRALSSAAIRLPRACPGVCDGIFDELLLGGFQNTLLISPPGGGKTTALRELIRRLSDRGYRVGVVDERNELAARDESGAQFDLGAHSDVLCGTDKGEGAMLLLRGMNPQIIAMDEISSGADLRAADEIVGCGVKLLASLHARDREELSLRPGSRQLLDKRIFRRLVVVSGVGNARRYRVESL